MVKEYMGQTFFDDWDFYDNCEYVSVHESRRVLGYFWFNEALPPEPVDAGTEIQIAV